MNRNNCPRNILYYLKYILVIIILFFLNFNNVKSQNPQCGNYYLIPKQDSFNYFQVNPANFSTLENSSYRLYLRSDIIIPVVVHIVWKNQDENISDERIIFQIEALNRDFNSENSDLSEIPDEFKSFAAKNGIHFCLASKNPEGIAVSGIERRKTDLDNIGIKSELYSTDLGGMDAWDTYRYLNIWVANTGENITGFGTLPGMVSPEKDGVVVNSKYFGPNEQSIRFNLGRVAVHETGHYLGLKHTWGDDEDCNSDDGVIDTPPQLHEYSGCPAYPQFSCGSSNMFMNFMDYVDDDCMVLFTEGQMEKMLNVLDSFRPGLKLTEIPCVQITDIESKLSFQIFPNPASSEISINFNEIISESGEITIYNTIGQKILKLKTILYNQMKIELPQLAQGIYWLKIGNSSQKLIIAR